MAGYTVRNLKDDVDDQALNFGLSPQLESRMARVPLELENFGLTYLRLEPGYRPPFRHTHKGQEEAYVVASGSARAKLGDDAGELKQWDVVRGPNRTMRRFEARPPGVDVIAVGP